MALPDFGEMTDEQAAVWEAHERAQDRALDRMFDFLEDTPDGS